MQIDSLDAFDASVYGLPHKGTIDFVKNQFTQGWENLTEAEQKILYRTSEEYSRRDQPN